MKTAGAKGKARRNTPQFGRNAGALAQASRRASHACSRRPISTPTQNVRRDPPRRGIRHRRAVAHRGAAPLMPTEFRAGRFAPLIARPTAETIVAELDGAICGYAMILFRHGTALARLYSIAVDPAAPAEASVRCCWPRRSAPPSTMTGSSCAWRCARTTRARSISTADRGYRPIGRYLDYYEDHTRGVALRKDAARRCADRRLRFPITSRGRTSPAARPA